MCGKLGSALKIQIGMKLIDLRFSSGFEGCYFFFLETFKIVEGLSVI